MSQYLGPENPMVSIIIPVFNGASFVAEAIDSALSQDYDNIEVLVIDDGSTDNSPSILERYRGHEKVRLLFHEGHRNQGVSRTRRLGVLSSLGKYVAFLDADDVFLPGKISHQVSILEANPEVVVCHGAIELISDEINTPKLERYFSLSNQDYKYEYKAEKYFLKQNRLCNSTSIVRSDIAKQVSFGFQQIFQYEDFLLWILLSGKGLFYFTPQRLTKYRFHPLSATARALEKPLLQQYSRIELCLTLLSRIGEDKVKAKIIANLRQNILALIEEYGKGSPYIAVAGYQNDILNEIFERDFSAEARFFEEKCRVLEDELEAIKETMVWKFSRFIRKILRYRPGRNG